jgi:hypothetical protein
MKLEAAQAFAGWLQKNEPELFAALVAQVGKQQQLSGITDFFSAIGSGIKSAASSVASGLNTAAKSVGSFLASPSGVSTIAQLGQTYLQSQAQKGALQVQLAAAQAGLQPAPIETRYDAATNTYVPVLNAPGTAVQPLTPQLTSQLLAATRGGFDWQTWALIGGGVFAVGILIWLTTRSRD